MSDSIALPRAAAHSRPLPASARPDLLVRWLWGVAAMVMAILVIGGITRLTESGLSITEWRPVTGTLPPLSDAAWQAEFDKYRQIPEYQLINKGMSLEDFQFIYFWEWLHRLWGRLIGMAMLVPLVWFMVRRMIPAGYTGRLWAVTSLIGLQGAIGWWMVASGLEVRTDVSHLRLAAHLLTALFILAALVWTAQDLARLHRTGTDRPARLTGYALLVAAVLLVQLLLGAWTAGLNAGYVANTWPLMNDRFYPDGVDWSAGAVFALTHDPFLVHFLHRWWAWAVAGVLGALAVGLWRDGARALALGLGALLLVQMALGILTVVTSIAIVPAVMHQGVGGALVIVLTLALHRRGLAGTRIAPNP